MGIEVRQNIDLCWSEKGQEIRPIRSNAEMLKVKFAKAWEEDGHAIRHFLVRYA